MKAKVLCVSLVVAQSLWAMNVDRHTFYTRDYLDFGQNLGQFTPGAKILALSTKRAKKLICQTYLSLISLNLMALTALQ